MNTLEVEIQYRHDKLHVFGLLFVSHLQMKELLYESRSRYTTRRLTDSPIVTEVSYPMLSLCTSDTSFAFPHT